MGSTIVTKFVWLWCEILVSSSFLRVNLTMPGREFVMLELLLEDLSLGR